MPICIVLQMGDANNQLISVEHYHRKHSVLATMQDEVAPVTWPHSLGLEQQADDQVGLNESNPEVAGNCHPHAWTDILLS